MKRLLALMPCIFLLIFTSGCSFKSITEDFNPSKIVSEIQSQFYELKDGQAVTEVVVEEFYISEPKFNRCYSALNKRQKEIYETLYAIAEKMPEGFVRLCENSSDIMTDISVAYSALLNDRAEIFWMPNTYILGRISGNYSRNVTIAFSYSDGENKSEYTVNKNDRDRMRQELEKAVNDIVAKADNLGGQYEIEKFFNDYICQNTNYTLESRLGHTAYGCLVEKNALCEGYSRAFKLLCNSVGIECDLISGTANGEGHMWNVVNIGGIHSLVDVTWNDRPEGISYAYFNITDEQLGFDHQPFAHFSEVSGSRLQDGYNCNFVEHKCTYTGNSYYVKNGLILRDGYWKNAAETVEEYNKKGFNTIGFLLDGKMIINDFKKDETKFIKKIQKELKDVALNSYSFERDVLTLYF